MIEIISNGSGPAKPIEALYDVLGKYQLDPTNNGISEEAQGRVRFWGNFLDLSHVFQIRTDEVDVIDRLRVAIHANRNRPDYILACDVAEQAHRQYVKLLRSEGKNTDLVEARWTAFRPVR